VNNICILQKPSEQYASILFCTQSMFPGWKTKWKEWVRDQFISCVVCSAQMEVKWRIARSDSVSDLAAEKNNNKKTCFNLCIHEIKLLDLSLNYVCNLFALIVTLQLSCFLVSNPVSHVCFRCLYEEQRWANLLVSVS